MANMFTAKITEFQSSRYEQFMKGDVITSKVQDKGKRNHANES